MKIVFSGFPALPHLLPFAALGRAATASGHRVALLTDPGLRTRLAPEFPGVPVLSAGPSWPVLVAESARRVGGDPRTPPSDPAAVAELLAGTRIDLGAEDAIESVWAWRPDVIVSEVNDFVGPLVAATLGVPRAVLAWSPAVPEEFVGAMAEVAAERYAQRGLAPSAPLAFIDLCPPALQRPGFTAPPRHLPMRPTALRRGRPYLAEPGPGRGRPAVLVVLATALGGRDVLVDALRSLDHDRLDVRASPGSAADADLVGDVDPRVRLVPPAAPDELLAGVEVVVGTGEAGTLLGALAHGLPTVLLPQGADEPLHAARAAAAGAALVAGAPHEVGPAVTRVLGDPSFRAAARSVRSQIARMPMPTAVVTAVVTALRELSPSRHPERPSRARGRRPQYA